MLQARVVALAPVELSPRFATLASLAPTRAHSSDRVVSIKNMLGPLEKARALHEQREAFEHAAAMELDSVTTVRASERASERSQDTR